MKRYLLLLGLALMSLFMVLPADAQIDQMARTKAQQRKAQRTRTHKATTKRTPKKRTVRRQTTTMAVADSVASDVATTTTRRPKVRYEVVSDFDEGAAVVYSAPYYGLIDEEGHLLTDLVYDEIDPVGDGIFWAKRNFQEGYLDETGEAIVPCTYSSVGEFQNGLARVQRGQLFGYVDEEGNEVIPCSYEVIKGPDAQGRFFVTHAGKQGCLSTTGQELIPCEYTSIGAISSEGYAWVAKFNLMGIYDINNHKEFVPCKYNSALVQHGMSLDKVDFKGVPEWSASGMIHVCKDSRWGVINRAGQEVAPCEWYYVSPFNNGLAWVLRMSRYGILKYDGTMVQPCDYAKVEYKNESRTFRFDEENVLVDFKNELIYVTKMAKTGLLNPDGTQLVPLEYDSIGVFHNGTALVKQRGHYGFMTQRGTLLLPVNLLAATEFSEGLAAIKRQDNKDEFVFVDDNFREQFSIKADAVGTFQDGRCLVTRKDKSYYIDKQGKKLK